MERTRTGLEVAVADSFVLLRGMRVGLVTNPSAVLPDLTTAADALARAPGVKLRSLFGPEHGVRGDIPAGKYVPTSRDPLTGVPVYSLYGQTKVPTAAMLQNLDALVFDIQDIGSRSYTYLSTLGSVMEGAARNNVPLFVFDRPNPLGGLRVEGSPTENGFRSFVGKYPIPYRHGMTLGELAQMINGRGWLPGGKQCQLTVVPCQNWTRNRATWDANGGLPWVPTSPHIPHADTPHFYAATGIAGELTSLSIGVGYTLPFEMAGAPGVSSATLARTLDARNLPGIRVRPASWRPFYAAFSGQMCYGVQIYLTDPAQADLTGLNFEILCALRAQKRPLFTAAATSKMFDLVSGNDRIRRALTGGASASEIKAIWNSGRDTFLRDRSPYLLYTK